LRYYGDVTPLIAIAPDRLKLRYERSEYRRISLADVEDGKIGLELANGEALTLRPLNEIDPPADHQGFVGTWRSVDTPGAMHIFEAGDGFGVATSAYKGHAWQVTH